MKISVGGQLETLAAEHATFFTGSAALTSAESVSVYGNVVDVKSGSSIVASAVEDIKLSSNNVDLHATGALRLSAESDTRVVNGGSVKAQITENVEAFVGGESRLTSDSVAVNVANQVDITTAGTNLYTAGNMQSFATGTLEFGASSGRGVVSGDA